MIRDETRAKAIWARIRASEIWSAAGVGMEETWYSVRSLIPKNERMREIYALEAEYLREHPDSGYLIEILPLKSFPDYIDYLPNGSIVRKIGVMGYLPEQEVSTANLITLSREELTAFVQETTELVAKQLVGKNLYDPTKLNYHNSRPKKVRRLL
jgi:hypothetical protein